MCKGISNENLSLHLEKKRLFYTVKITTYLRSKTKDLFMEDCLRKNVRESELARDIIEKYYQIIRQYPHLFETEMTALKTLLSTKIKFRE